MVISYHQYYYPCLALLYIYTYSVFLYTHNFICTYSVFWSMYTHNFIRSNPARCNYLFNFLFIFNPYWSPLIAIPSYPCLIGSLHHIRMQSPSVTWSHYDIYPTPPLPSLHSYSLYYWVSYNLKGPIHCSTLIYKTKRWTARCVVLVCRAITRHLVG